MLTEERETQIDEVPPGMERAIDAKPYSGQKSFAAFCGLPEGPKIMMVDDEKLNNYVVAEYLKPNGYRELISTVNPLEALAMARRTHPDAVLLDIQMPQLDGLEILRQIRADDDDALARTPVVILTSLTDDEVKVRALELGASDFLNKPIHSGELLARLRNVLMAKAYQDQWLQQQASQEAQLDPGQDE